MTLQGDTEVLADRLTVAIAANDAEAMAAIYAPDAVIWHCTDQVELDLDQLRAIMRGLAAIADAEVTVKSRFATDAGFAQTHESIYTLRTGEATSFRRFMPRWWLGSMIRAASVASRSTSTAPALRR